VRALTIILALATAPAASAMTAPPAASGLEIAPGITLIATPVEGARTIAVRLDLALGLDSEGEGAWGMAALALAALRDGPTRHLAARQPVAVGARAGLRTDAALHRDHLAVTLVGPPEALETALWLTAERLDPEESPLALLEDLHERLLRTPGQAPPPPPPPLEHTYTNLFGPLGGHTAYTSHQRARSDLCEALAAMVMDALPRAHARISVAAAPEVIALLPKLARRHLRGLAARPGGPVPRRDPSLDHEWQRRRPGRVVAQQRYDGRRIATVAWDLRGLGGELGLTAAWEEALRRVVVALLEAPGGLINEPLIDAFGLARHVEVLATTAPPSVAVIATVRGRDIAGGRARILELIAPILERNPPERLLDGARRLAQVELLGAWAHPSERLALMAEWWRAGVSAAPEVHARAVLDALAAIRPRDVVSWVEYALHDSRRVVVELTPTTLPAEDRVVLDADTMSVFLRLVVDLRCPPPGRSVDLADLLADKYELTTEGYLALSRVVGREPERMAILNHEAEQRCLEYKKLREMMPTRQVVAMHRAVACQAGRVADDAERDAVLAAIFRRFDVDPSVYRPMVAMAREDMDVAATLARVDADCRPEWGPAAPR